MHIRSKSKSYLSIHVLATRPNYTHVVVVVVVVLLLFGVVFRRQACLRIFAFEGRRIYACMHSQAGWPSYE